MNLPTYMPLADIHAIGGEGQFAPWQPLPPNNARPLTRATTPKAVTRLVHVDDRAYLLDSIRKAYFMSPTEIESWNVPITNLGVIQWDYMPSGWTAEVHPVAADATRQGNWRWVENEIVVHNNRIYYNPDRENVGGDWVKASNNMEDADSVAINTDNMPQHTFNSRLDEYRNANLPYGAVWETGMGAQNMREYSVLGLFSNYNAITNPDEVALQAFRQDWVARRLMMHNVKDWQNLMLPHLATDYFIPLLALLENLRYVICDNNPPAVFMPQAVRVDEQIITMARAERNNFNNLFPMHVWPPTMDPQLPQVVWNRAKLTAEGLQVRIWRTIHETFEFMVNLWRGFEDEERISVAPNNNNPATRLRGAKMAGVLLPGELQAPIINPYAAMYPSPLTVPYLGGMAGAYMNQAVTPTPVAQVAALKVKAEVKPEHLPKFSGIGRDLISWMQQLDMWAEQINPDQLAGVLPLTFEGKQAFWWRTRTPQQQLLYRASWKEMRKAILEHYMNTKWRGDRQKEVENIMFRDKFHPNETVLEYWIRIHTLCVTAFAGMQDAVIIEHFLKGGPSKWDDLLPMDVRKDINKFQVALDEYEDKLTRVSRQKESSRREFKKLTQQVAAMQEVIIAATQEKDQRRSFKRESKPNVNKKAPREKMKPFYRGPPLDSVRSNNTPKSKGLAGCWICKSDQHFGRDCPKWKSEMDLQKQAKKTMVAANITYEAAHIVAAMKEKAEDSDSDGPPNISEVEESEKEANDKESSDEETESEEDF